MTTSAPQNTTEKPDPIFEPIKWHYDPSRHDEASYLQCAVKDIGRGIETVLLAVESSDVAVSNGDAALFDDYSRGTLVRLAICSMRMLASIAEDAIDKANDAYLAKNAGGRHGKK
ncbi:MAG: hypothetical protein JWR22_1296 [Herminiimonas sp.]|nr:hypothetical protein [Herminiimonas sp.]